MLMVATHKISLMAAMNNFFMFLLLITHTYNVILISPAFPFLHLPHACLSRKFLAFAIFCRGWGVLNYCLARTAHSINASMMYTFKVNISHLI